MFSRFKQRSMDVQMLEAQAAFERQLMEFYQAYYELEEEEVEEEEDAEWPAEPTPSVEMTPGSLSPETLE